MGILSKVNRYIEEARAEHGADQAAASTGDKVDRDGRPSWWDNYVEENPGAKWKPEYSNAYSAYQNILGREPENFGALTNWAFKDYGEATRLMSLSEEALGRGVNPEDYGNVAIDPANTKSPVRTIHSSLRFWLNGKMLRITASNSRPSLKKKNKANNVTNSLKTNTEDVCNTVPACPAT